MTGNITQNSEEAIEILTSSSDPQDRFFGRLIATGVFETFANFMRVEEKNGTDFQTMVIGAAQLSSHTIGNFFHHHNEEDQAQQVGVICKHLEGLMLAHLQSAREENITEESKNG